MNYQILNDDGAVINRIVADEAFVRLNFPGHWRAEPDVGGGDASTPPGPVTVPDWVPMLNAHLALIRDGKLDQLRGLVAALPDQDRQEADAYLNLAQTCRRDNKWVLQFGPSLGYDSAALDRLFITAAALNP